MSLDNCRTKAEYMDGISCAGRAGGIVSFGGGKLSDSYGHISHGLMAQNTRGMELVVDSLLRIAPGNAEVLELGAGAGAVASAISDRFRGVVLDTLAREPLNPYLKFAPALTFTEGFLFMADHKVLSAWPRIKRMFEAVDEEHVRRLVRVPGAGLCSLNPFFQLQRDLQVQVTSYVDQPFVRRQYIGLVDVGSGFPDFLGQYDLVVERYGPLYYSFGLTVNRVKSVFEHVKEAGAMITAVMGAEMKELRDALDQASFGSDFVFVASWEGEVPDILLLKEGHALYERAKSWAVLGGKKKNGILVPSLSAWVENAVGA
jgi:hypothetical protein